MPSDELLTDVNGPVSKLTALYVYAYGPVTIDEACRELDEGKLTVLPVVTNLCEDGVIDRDGSTLHATSE